VLLAIGLAQILYGVVGPISNGAAMAEVIVERLDLNRDPDTYIEIGNILAGSATRLGIAWSAMGALIAVVAGYGLFVASKLP